MENTNNQMSLVVEGMTCNHCKASVEGAASALPGVVSASVDLASKTLTVVGRADMSALRSAITELGFEPAPAT